MRRVTPASIFAVISMAASHAGLAQGPSFDCARATTPTEKAICASSELSWRDADIAVM